MLNYKFTKESECSMILFKKEISKAKSFLIKRDSLSEISFKEKRHSIDIGYIIGKTEYSGEYITYEIKNGIELIGYLNCFLSSENDYMEVIFESI